MVRHCRAMLHKLNQAGHLREGEELVTVQCLHAAVRLHSEAGHTEQAIVPVPRSRHLTALA